MNSYTEIIRMSDVILIIYPGPHGTWKQKFASRYCILSQFLVCR